MAMGLPTSATFLNYLAKDSLSCSPASVHALSMVSIVFQASLPAPGCHEADLHVGCTKMASTFPSVLHSLPLGSCGGCHEADLPAGCTEMALTFHFVLCSFPLGSCGDFKLSLLSGVFCKLQ